MILERILPRTHDPPQALLFYNQGCSSLPGGRWARRDAASVQRKVRTPQGTVLANGQVG